MALSWNVGTQEITFSGSATHTTANIVSTINNTTYATDLTPTGASGNIYALKDVRVILGAGCVWSEVYANTADNPVWVYHSWHGNSAAVEFGSSTARMEFGSLEVDDDDVPVTSRSHHYWFMTYNANANFHWSRYTTTGAPGIFRFYGGMFEVITTLRFDNGGTATISAGDTITGGTSGATAVVTVVTVETGSWAGNDAAGTLALSKVVGVFEDNETIGSALVVGTNICPEIYMPSTECDIVQSQWSRFGGLRFFGTNNRVLETKFKRSPGKGFSFDGINASTFRKIQLVDSEVALTLTGSGKGTIRGFSLRSNTADMSVDIFDGILELIDSTTISVLSGTLDFDDVPASSYVVEQNSYKAQIVDSSGDGVNSIRTQVYAKLDGSLYGTEQLTSTIDTIDGSINERIANKSQYDQDHLTVETKLDYGNFGFRARDYGRRFIDRAYIPGEAPISDILQVTDNLFTVDGPGGQYDNTTAAAYTGVAIVEALTAASISLEFEENSPSADAIVRTTGSFITDGWADGMYVWVTGSDDNNGIYLISSVTALTMTLDSTEDLTAVAAGTGVQLRGWSVNITSGTANTLNKIYSKLQAIQEGSGELDTAEFLRTNDGNGYAMPPASVITGLDTQATDLEGGFVTQQDGVSRLVGVIVTGVVSGTELSVVRASDSVVLGAATTTGTSHTIVTNSPGSDIDVYVRARKAGYKFFEIKVNLSTSGQVIAANFPVDTEYN